MPADGTSTVATATTIGHIAVWGLDERRLVAVVRDAHNGSVGGMEFIQSQPLMATSSVDNSIKVFISIHSSRPVYKLSQLLILSIVQKFDGGNSDEFDEWLVICQRFP